RAELAKFREPWRLVVSPLDHPEQRTYLTSLYEAAYAPAWSPDGKSIIYDRDGKVYRREVTR
ncbi:MAG: PD40 domain-containing protein, partial [Kiritimatiellae bacterium]|nr:PD40 domain-containing protein [Kiritimatiellia bacterium]